MTAPRYQVLVWVKSPLWGFWEHVGWPMADKVDAERLALFWGQAARVAAVDEQGEEIEA